VAVEVQTFRPFYVLGEVHHPGEFPYVTGMTVLSAIAKAGGYDYRAWEGEVLLVREANGEQKEYRATERTPILPGDIIKILQRRI
jgi:polysaccharide export outer membrane protein